MESKAQLLQLCQDYLKHYPSEKDRLSTFQSFLGRNTTESLYTRKNFDGHITASVFVVNKELSKLLLVYHNTLNKWLQPGGHVEQSIDTNIYEAALRECVEETSISSDQLTLVQADTDAELPFDIDSHLIPANDRKNEAAHYHHDFRYLLIHDGSSSVTINTEESEAYQWCAFTDLAHYKEFKLMTSKIEVLLGTIKKAI